MRAIFEPRAGMLAVDDCVSVCLGQAALRGADVELGVAASSWRREGDGVAVSTTDGELFADRLVLTPGAWAPDLLRCVGPLEVRRKSLFWFRPDGVELDVGGAAPVFLYDTPAGIFYGMPAIDGDGVKIAEHTGGHAVRDPGSLDRDVDAEERARVERFTRAHLRGLTSELTRHAVCLYTMSADEHFIVGVHPEHPPVSFAVGLSGHGFKFAPVLGEVLADLAIDGATAHPVELFSPSRFGAN